MSFTIAVGPRTVEDVSVPPEITPREKAVYGDFIIHSAVELEAFADAITELKVVLI